MKSVRGQVVTNIEWLHISPQTLERMILRGKFFTESRQLNRIGSNSAAEKMRDIEFLYISKF